MTLRIHADVQFTRKHSLTYVLDENDVLLFSGKGIEPALRYLLEAGHTEAVLTAQTARYKVTFEPIKE